MADEYANVTLAHKIHSDRRFDLMAEIAGWSRWEAVGRMSALFARCTALQTDRPLPEVIRVHLGLRGEQLLVESTLGERCEDGSIRVKGGGLTGGDTDRFGWYEPVREQQREAGAKRAKTAIRGPGGKFGPGPARSSAHPADTSASSTAGPAEPAEHQRTPAPIQPPDSGSQRRDLPPARDPSVPSLAPDQQQTPPAGPRGDRDPKPENAIRPNGEAPMIWRELEQARAEAGAELKLRVLPLPVGDRGERDLADLFKAARERGPEAVELLVQQARHAIAVAGAEARSDRSRLKWFSGAIFSGDNFRRLVAEDIEQAGRPRAGPRGSAERATKKLLSNTTGDEPDLDYRPR